MRVLLNRQLIGLEDITFGIGTVEQTRGGETVTITKVNAANLPFDEINTLKDVLDTVYPAIEIVAANIIDINNAEENANIAIAKAGEALASAQAADLSEANALASAQAADLSEANALASAQAAANYVATAMIDDTSISTSKTYSSSKIIAITDTKTPYSIINEDSAVKLISLKTKKSWTKGFSGTGALQIELQNLYGFSLDGMMQVRIKETTGNAIVINIDGRWDASSTWSSYNATSDTSINVRFAKDSSKAYILLGDTSKVWGNTRIEIDNILCNYNVGLNLDFIMSVVSSYPTIVVATVDAMNKANVGQTMYIGTSGLAINRASGNVSLTGTSIDGNAGTATKLAATKTIGMTGDVTYTSAGFDGSGNVTGTATLANSGVTAGTYGSVTVDAKGRVTAASANPADVEW